jgi:hypothetical protein
MNATLGEILKGREPQKAETMKTYPFIFDGKKYALSEFTPAADEALVATPGADGWKRAFAILIQPADAVTPELLDALWVESKNPNTSFYRALRKADLDAHLPV